MKWRHLWLIPVCIGFGYVVALLVVPWFGVLCCVCLFALTEIEIHQRGLD